MLTHAQLNGNPPPIFTYEYYARLYQMEERHWWSVGMRTIAARLLDPRFHRPQVLRILDAGCGTGGNLSWLQRYAGPQEIIGIDVSRYALEFCQTRQLRQLTQASITDLPFSNESFDLIICTNVLQHLPRDGSDARAITECYRVLRPGGLLYVLTNVRRGGEDSGTGRPISPHANFHQYERREIARKFAQTGFVLEKVTYADMLSALVEKWTFWFKSSLSRHRNAHEDRGVARRVPPGWINTFMKAAMRAEALYVCGSSRNLPLGHSLICLAAKPA